MGQMDTASTMAAIAESIHAWYDKHCGPVVQAIYVKDEYSAVALLADARYVLETSDISEDIKDAIRYRLRYIQWQMERICQSYGQVTVHAQRACADLERPAGNVMPID